MKLPPANYQWKLMYGLDIVATVLLLWSAYLLSDTGAYHRYSYYETLRNVVSLAWLIAAFRFYVFGWLPVSFLSMVLAWLFNPIVPVTMRKWQWQPYDHWAMILSVAAAVTLALLSFRAHRTVLISSTPTQR
jgi:hypothetical protein